MSSALSNRINAFLNSSSQPKNRLGYDKSFTTDSLICNGLVSRGKITSNSITGTNIVSSSPTANAIIIDASRINGGIDIIAETNGINVTSTGGENNLNSTDSITIIANDSIQFLDINSLFSLLTSGPINIESTFAGTNTINAINGGIDIDSGQGGILFESSGLNSFQTTLNSLDSINFDSDGIIEMNTSGQINISCDGLIGLNTPFGVIFNSGTQGNQITSNKQISFTSNSNSNQANYLEGQTINLNSQNGGFLFNTNGQILVNLDTGDLDFNSGGGIDIDTISPINLITSDSTNMAIELFASNANGGIDMNNGSGGFDVDVATGPITLTTTSLTGNDLNLTADVGGNGFIDFQMGSNGMNIGSTDKIQLDTSSNTSDSIFLNAGALGSGIQLNLGSDGLDLDTTGQISFRSLETGSNSIYFISNDADNYFVVNGGRDHHFIDSGDGIHEVYEQQGTTTITPVGMGVFAYDGTDAGGILTITAGNGSVTITFTFADAYSNPPLVIASVGAGDPVSYELVVAPTTTEFTLGVSPVLSPFTTKINILIFEP